MPDGLTDTPDLSANTQHIGFIGRYAPKHSILDQYDQYTGYVLADIWSMSIMTLSQCFVLPITITI